LSSIKLFKINPFLLLILLLCLSTISIYIINLSKNSQNVIKNEVELSGYTSIQPTIDGIIENKEWENASKVTFGPIITLNGKTINGIVYMMNDDKNLYIAVLINGDNDFDSTDGFEVFFNNNGNERSFEDGDDFIAIRGKNLFFDGYYYKITNAINPDTIDEGTNDGKGAGSHEGLMNQFEISHPLNSSDSLHDFSLSLKQKVGFLIRIYIDGKHYDLSAWGLGEFSNSPRFANYIVASSSSRVPH